MPVTEPIEFSFDAPTWSLGKSMAAHIAMRRIGEVYRKDLKDTIYQICGRRDEHWEMISTRKDISIVAFIQELNQQIRRQENQMCANMIDLKKARTRIKELEEELKATREDYEEEIEVLVEKNDDLIKKIGIFMGGPTPVDEDEEPRRLARKTTSSSTTPIRIQTEAMMTMVMKLEQISWSLQPKNISSRPPHQ